jgi:RimJ/RimL family protein N-acetyltransferase
VALKLRYEIDLTNPIPETESEAPPVRPITKDDLDGLAQLMLDAYLGTIDYEDEDLDDAIEEVRSFFEDGHPLLAHSYLVEVGGTVASAILVSRSEGKPFIGYVMTLPAHKNHGLARRVTTAALESLAREGHKTVVLYITDGNRPSEALFRSVGAIQIPST